METGLRVIDLFAGCGGLSLGFRRAGFDVCLAVDNWRPAINVYALNFQQPVLDLDLADVDGCVAMLGAYQPDVLVGGPPCADFSSAGTRDEDGCNGRLTLSFARLVARMRPRFFVMENVGQLLGTRQYHRARELFHAYGLTVQTLNACHYGVPQRRERVFVIGARGACEGFLFEQFRRHRHYKPMTMRDYFGDSLGCEFYYRPPRTYGRRAVFGLDEPSPTIRGVNRPMPAGRPWHPDDATRDASKVRPLSTRERSRVQTFPPDFLLRGSATHLDQMIGNAVPVRMATHVAECLREWFFKSGRR